MLNWITSLSTSTAQLVAVVASVFAHHDYHGVTDHIIVRTHHDYHVVTDSIIVRTHHDYHVHVVMDDFVVRTP